MMRRVRTAESLALLLLALCSFHIFSPVADFLFAGSNAVYAATLLLVAAYLLFRRGRQPRLASEFRHPVAHLANLGFLLLACFCLAHLVAHPDSAWTNARYLGILAAGWLMFRKMDAAQLDRLARGLIRFFTVYFLFAAAAYALFALGWLDFHQWNLDSLRFLPGTSALRFLPRSHGPILIEEIAPSGGTDVFMPFYLITIPRSGDTVGFGPFRFMRLTGIFMEPTDLALVIGPLLLYALDLIRRGEKKYIFRALALAALFTWAFSISGFIAMALASTAHKITADFRRPTLTRLLLGCALFLALAGVGLLVLLAPRPVIAFLGSAKQVQYDTLMGLFSSRGQAYLDPSAFGCGFEYTKNTFLGYGLSSVLVRQGCLGALSLAVYLCPFLFCLGSMLKSKKSLHGRIACYMMLMLFKTSEMVNLYFMIWYVMALRIWLARNATSTPSSAKLEYEPAPAA